SNADFRTSPQPVTTETFDIAVIGAGMAGASLAAELAPYARVSVIEAEDAPGYHTTGRSAAFWEETYGGPGVVPSTMASGGYSREHGFSSPRGALSIATAEDRHKLEAYAESFGAMGIHIEWQSRAAMDARVPGLRPEWAFATWEPDCSDIDVAGSHQHYSAIGRRAGTVSRVRARVSAVEREAAGWRVVWGEGQGAGAARAAIVVNAAGAWADEVATLAGAAPVGISPSRRTIVQLRTDPEALADMPSTSGINGDFYFKPQAGRLWLSPHDEIPDVPCDAAPEESDVAVAIDRFEHVSDWRIAASERRWAGSRSFAPDRLPVYGFDPSREGFFWFAGQGGFGIQTAPAAARSAAQISSGHPDDAMTAGIDRARYAPSRFAMAA
ncbi:hypothetical protein OY671_007856, partial [Metschnikowia pulcherrima]